MKPRFQFSLRALLIAAAIVPLIAYLAYQFGGLFLLLAFLAVLLLGIYLLSFGAALAIVASTIFFADRTATLWSHLQDVPSRKPPRL